MIDVDGDGILEIVLGSPSNPTPYFNAIKDALWVFRPTGRLIEGFPVLLDDSGCSTPAVGDVNGDGMPEMFVGSSINNLSTDRKVYGFDSVGSNLPGWPLMTEEGERRYVYAAPSLGDLDGDGLPEIIYGSRNGLLYACEMDGTPVSGWPVDLKITPIDGIGGSPALGDIDNDGSLDVVVYLSEGYLYALNADGTRKAGWPKRLGARMDWGFPAEINETKNIAEVISAPVLCDLDGNGDLEVILFTNTPKAALFVLNHRGQILSGFPALLEDDDELFEAVRSTPAVGDIDGDGHREFAVWSDSGKLWVFKDDGTIPSGWPKSLVLQCQTSDDLPKALWKPSYAAIADIDYDGMPEVLAPGKNVSCYLYGLEANAEDVSGWPILIDRPMNNMPTVDDLDGDGALDLVMSNQGMAHCLHVKRNGSTVDPLLPWRMFHHDPFRTGNAHAWLPSLTDGMFERKGGWVGPDEFVFSVSYHDDDGDIPKTAELKLVDPSGNAATHQMHYLPEGLLAESEFNGRYVASVRLTQPGRYRYSFHFWDGYRFHYKTSNQTDHVWLPSEHTYISGPDVALRGPTILAAGFEPSSFSSSEGTELSIKCYVDHPAGPSAVERVELLYDDISTGIVLNDSGESGDAAAGDSVFSYELTLSSYAISQASYLLSIAAWDYDGNRSSDWPFIPGETSFRSTPRAIAGGVLSVTMSETTHPQIKLSGASVRKLDPDGPAYLRLIALVAHPEGPSAIQRVSVLFEGLDSGLVLKDDGMSGDDLAGDSIYSMAMEVPAVNSRNGAVLELIATDTDGNASDLSPYLWVTQ